MAAPTGELEEFAERAIEVRDVASARRLVADVYRAGADSVRGLPDEELRSLLANHGDAGLVSAVKDHFAAREPGRERGQM